jgi:hypothetical protein
LEHFVDPWETLRACQPLLTPTGRVVASIPNIRWLNTSLRLLLRGEWRYEETGMLDRTHLRFFTRSGIHTLFADSGFEIVELYPFNQHTATGRAAAILRLFGHRFDDLLAMHFAVAAVHPLVFPTDGTWVPGSRDIPTGVQKLRCSA